MAAGTLAFRLTGSGVRGVTEAVGGAGAGSGARRCSTGAGRCRGIQWVTVAAGADLVGADRVCTALLAKDVLLDFRPGVGLRLAPHFYTRDDEVDRAMKLVRDEVTKAAG